MLVQPNNSTVYYSRASLKCYNGGEGSKANHTNHAARVAGGA